MKCQIMTSAIDVCNKHAISEWQPYVALASMTANIPVCEEHANNLATRGIHRQTPNKLSKQDEN